MEEGVFTLWSIVHIFSGIVLAFLFSLKDIKLIEFAGLFALPFLLINYNPLRVICLVIIAISLIALFTKHFSRKFNGPTFFHSVTFAFLLLIAWEIIEYFTAPITSFGKESLLNRVSDLIFGSIGFLIVYPHIHKMIKKKPKKRKSHKK